LLSKEDWRTALGEEAVKDGPEMATVGCPLHLAADGEWLAWQTGTPTLELLASGEHEDEGPAADAGEEVSLAVSDDVVWANGFNWSFINKALLDQPALHQIAQPLAQERLALVEVEAAGGHLPGLC
jgi:hypothetical protein